MVEKGHVSAPIDTPADDFVHITHGRLTDGNPIRQEAIQCFTVTFPAATTQSA